MCLEEFCLYDMIHCNLDFGINDRACQLHSNSIIRVSVRHAKTVMVAVALSTVRVKGILSPRRNFELVYYKLPTFSLQHF